MNLLGCIADDFTGATDLASMLVRAGLKTYLLFDAKDINNADLADAQAIIIALKCRSIAAQAANMEVLAALNVLKKLGCDSFFWKYCSTFDSTATGNIATVTAMLLEELKEDYTIYCPAFPENGRTVYNGYLFVLDKILSDSPMRHHPLNPMHESNLRLLIKQQISQEVGLISYHDLENPSLIEGKIAEIKSSGIKHVVVDCLKNEHLDFIARCFKEIKLFTGGSALAKSLGNNFSSKKYLEKNFPKAAAHGPVIVLSGSCSEMSLKQLARAKSLGVPSFFIDPFQLASVSNQQIWDWVESHKDSPMVIIYCSDTIEKVAANALTLSQERMSSLLEHKLGELAKLLQDRKFNNFIVAGGETSGSVVKYLNIKSVEVGKSIEPGVPICYDKGNGIFIILKSGNFGKENFYERSLTQLLGT